MVTLNALVHETSRQLPPHILRGGFTDPDELASDLLADLLTAEDLPVRVVSLFRRALRRRLGTIRKRLQRQHNRHESLKYGPCTASDPAEEVANRDLLTSAVTSDFDTEALAAELCGDFAEFAETNRYCSRGEAYKRRQSLHARVRRLANGERI